MSKMAAQSNRDETGGRAVGSTAWGVKKIEGDGFEQHKQGTKA